MIRKILRILGSISLFIELILLAIALISGNSDSELTAWFMALFLVPTGIILLALSFLRNPKNIKPNTDRISNLSDQNL